MPVITVGKSSMLTYFHSHVHSLWEVVLNLRGHGETLIGDTLYEYRPGTIICLPPLTPHTKFCEGQFQDVYMQLSDPLLLRVGESSGVQLFTDDSDKSVETLMLMANRIFHKREPGSRAMTEALGAAVVQWLLGRGRSPAVDGRVEQLQSLLADSFTNPELSLAAAMDTCGYCRDHLRRLFRKETGISPQEYLTNLRLGYAKKLMRENASLHYSIGEISTMSGFYDSGYFSRLFKRTEGITPREYAERERKKD